MKSKRRLTSIEWRYIRENIKGIISWIGLTVFATWLFWETFTSQKIHSRRIFKGITFESNPVIFILYLGGIIFVISLLIAIPILIIKYSKKEKMESQAEANLLIARIDQNSSNDVT